MRFLMISLHRTAPFDQTSDRLPYPPPVCIEGKHDGQSFEGIFGAYLIWFTKKLIWFTKKTTLLNHLNRTTLTTVLIKTPIRTPIRVPSYLKKQAMIVAVMAQTLSQAPFKAEHGKPGSDGQGRKCRRPLSKQSIENQESEHGKPGSGGQGAKRYHQMLWCTNDAKWRKKTCGV